MKRGFFTTSKAKKQVEEGIFKPPPSRQTAERTPATDATDNDGYIYTTVPFVKHDARLKEVPGGFAAVCVTGDVKRAIDNEPGFPRVPLAPTGGDKAYQIIEVGKKGLGMLATRLIRAGDLILDERPLMFVPAVRPLGCHLFTLADMQQIMYRESERGLQRSFDMMSPENQKAFMALANSHQHDGSGPLLGRVRTNGIGCEELRDTNTTGRIGMYSAICDDISHLNHSCIPNTTYHWHTSSFSFRVYATCDIPSGTEITMSYCDPLDSAANRAKSLLSYGITSCGCGPSCDPMAERSKIGDARRMAFLNEPIVLTPGFMPKRASEPEDVWVQPAVKRLAELEEECLYGELYKSTLYQLVNAYTVLLDAKKVLMYANKLKGPYKAYEEEELLAMHLSEEEIRKSPYWMMGEMRKKMPSVPLLISIA